MTFLKTFILYLQTIYKLGIRSVIYIIWYRFTIKSGIRNHFFAQKNLEIHGDFLRQCQTLNNFPVNWKTPLLIDADKILQGQLRYYAFHWKSIGNPPNWFLNPFNNRSYPNTHLHWSKLPDFHPMVGDIKNVWEASRFEWVVTLARAYAVAGNPIYLHNLNMWLKDWVIKNPLNTGPNWKCGQETSIRLFNLINASFILDQTNRPTKALTDLINAHLNRISSNIRYAIAQNNNHGTSEAAALFIGGNWLNKTKYHYPKAVYFATQGRKWLENRIDKLVELDGSFSQHSVIYHRVLIDTLIFAEFWRQNLELPLFNKSFYAKARNAIRWLGKMTDGISGNCPNLGANDGAMFLNMHSCDYRDFRPTLQTANAIFNGTKILVNGPWDESLFWFGERSNSIHENNVQRLSQVLKGGYVILMSTNSWCLLRFPYYRFRPSHNDVFHFDLWYKGKNIIHDSGSFSYNPPLEDAHIDFNSVNAHNTVCFDGHEQMPRISRFLLGKWIRPDEIGSIKNHSDGRQSWQGAYTDARGNIHRRIISLNLDIWTIEDDLSGNFKTTTIGFNLGEEKISIENNYIKTSWGEIRLSPDSFFEIQTCFTSEYYWEKHSIQRLVIHLNNPQKFITTICLNQ